MSTAIAKYSFEVFKGRFKSVSSGKTPRVTISRRGIFLLNRAASEAIGKPPYVELLYEHSTQAIGIRPLAEPVQHAYKVRKQHGAESYAISAMAFFIFYGFPLESLLIFRPVVEDGILVLEAD